MAALIRRDDEPDNTDYRNELLAQAEEIDRQQLAQMDRHADIILAGIGWFYVLAAAAGLIFAVRWLIAALQDGSIDTAAAIGLAIITCAAAAVWGLLRYMDAVIDGREDCADESPSRPWGGA